MNQDQGGLLINEHPIQVDATTQMLGVYYSQQLGVYPRQDLGEYCPDQPQPQ